MIDRIVRDRTLFYKQAETLIPCRSVVSPAKRADELCVTVIGTHMDLRQALLT